MDEFAQRVPYEFAYGDTRCPPRSAPAAANRSQPVPRSAIRPSVQHQPVNVNDVCAGTVKRGSLIPTTATTSHAVSGPGWIAIPITGGRTGTSRPRTTRRRRRRPWRPPAPHSPACTGSSSGRTRLQRVTSGSRKLPRRARNAAAKRTRAKRGRDGYLTCRALTLPPNKLPSTCMATASTVH